MGHDNLHGDGNPGTNEDRDGNGIDRRSMLLAVGAGPSVALSGRFPRANGQEEADDANDSGERTQEGCPPCIDRYTGYLNVGDTTDERQAADISPAATVELRISDAGTVFTEDNGIPTESQDNGTQTESQGNETEPPAPPEPDPWIEESPDTYFDPVGIRLQPGATLEFLAREGFHIVAPFHPRLFGYQQRVPEGAPGFASPPIMTGDSWFYQFDESGVYDLLCLLHQGVGMVMRVVTVDEGSQDAPEGYPQPGRDEGVPSPLAQAVLDAPELEPQNIVERGTVQWTELTVEEVGQPFDPGE